MREFSNEIYLHILSYLWKEDQLEWCNCTRKWYNEILRGHIRKYRFRFSSDITEESISKWLNRLYQVIQKPLSQVEIYMPLTLEDLDSSPASNVHIFRLFSALNYALRKISFPVHEFEVISLLEQKEAIRLTELELYSQYNTIAEEALMKSFQKISDLQNFSIHLENCNYQAPYNSTVKELTIKYSALPDPVHVNYFSQLEKLELHYCSISDVSMLGDIPDLTLYCCPNITDISALCHNRRVLIDYCNRISDFSQSFENCETIEIIIQNVSVLNLNPEKWKKVKSFTLASTIVVERPFEIPRTVVKCHLRYDIISCINLCVSPSHALKEIVLSDDSANTITSLEDLGFERLVVIRLFSLSKLCSLRGIGSGRNQKVIIYNCPLITDYSPLRYVHEVKICNAEKVKLDELDHVHTLTIQAMQLIVNPNRCYDQLHSLDIRYSHDIQGFQGLVRIPVLVLSLGSLKGLQEYLENAGTTATATGTGTGGKLWNQRVDVAFYRHDESAAVERVRSFYHRFLESHYILLDTPKSCSSSYDYRVSLLQKKNGELYS